MNKKDIPLAVLECLEEYTSLHGKNFKVVSPDNFLVKIIDVDPHSKFYFHIEEWKINGGLLLLVNKCPRSKENISSNRAWINQTQLKPTFEGWVKLLQRYDEVKSFYDDPIISAYAEEYYTEYEIIDEDSWKPLNSDNARLLDKHLAYIEEHIEEYQTETNKADIENIKEDTRKIRLVITQESRAEILKKISILWGKLTKYIGVKVFDVFITESVKQIAKGVVQIFIETS